MLMDKSTSKIPTSFTADPELLVRLDTQAQARGLRRSELIREIIKRSLDQVQPPGPKLEFQVGFIQLAIDKILEHGYGCEVRDEVYALHKVYRDTYMQPGLVDRRPGLTADR